MRIVQEIPPRARGVREATVTGVVGEIPEPSHMGRSASAVLPFDLLASRDLYDAFAAVARPGGAMRFGSPWATQGNLTYVLFPADGSFSAERRVLRLNRQRGFDYGGAKQVERPC